MLTSVNAVVVIGHAAYHRLKPLRLHDTGRLSGGQLDCGRAF